MIAYILIFSERAGVCLHTPASFKAYYILVYFLNAPIAQLVEQIPLKDKVPGSSPGRRTKFHASLQYHIL